MMEVPYIEDEDFPGVPVLQLRVDDFPVGIDIDGERVRLLKLLRADENELAEMEMLRDQHSNTLAHMGGSSYLSPLSRGPLKGRLFSELNRVLLRYAALLKQHESVKRSLAFYDNELYNQLLVSALPALISRGLNPEEAAADAHEFVSQALKVAASNREQKA